jgi:hypothetical protein
MTGKAASPRVPAWTENLSPRNLSQDDFWNMETDKQAISLGTNPLAKINFANALVDQVMRK